MDGRVAELHEQLLGDCSLTLKAARAQALKFPHNLVCSLRHDRQNVTHMRVADRALRAAMHAELKFRKRSHEIALRLLVVAIGFTTRERVQEVVHIAGRNCIFSDHGEDVWSYSSTIVVTEQLQAGFR